MRLVGPDAEALAAPLAAAGFEADDAAATAVHVTLSGVVLDELEDALAGWVVHAREAAARDGDVVTVVADHLLDGEDVAGCGLGHGLVAATRAYAMERARAGGVGNVVATATEDLAPAVASVVWLLRERALSGEVLRAGARPHGRQRL